MNRNLLPKLDLNITNRCNYRCTHCAFDSGLCNMPEMSLGELENILKDTKDLGGRRIDITGGEALVRKDVPEIIKIGKDLDYKIELVTNGYLLNADKLRQFKELGLDGIAISIDGSDEQKYNMIRRAGKKAFDRVLQNIRLSKENDFYTKVNTTVFASNLHDLPNIAELCHGLNVNEWGLYYFTPIGRGDRSSELSVEPITWLEFVNNHLEPYKDRLNISLEYPLIEKGRWNKDMGCIADGERSHLQILPDGNVYPCAILASYGKPIANLHDVSVKDIWQNKELWKAYWQKISPMFKCWQGSCVDYKTAFNMKDYDQTKYGFVCPLRKFTLG
ncbi:radical SAM protein [Thermoproteota archaeon]